MEYRGLLKVATVFGLNYGRIVTVVKLGSIWWLLIMVVLLIPDITYIFPPIMVLTGLRHFIKLVCIDVRVVHLASICSRFQVGYGLAVTTVVYGMRYDLLEILIKVGAVGVFLMTDKEFFVV
jgi:hypothetical protein